MQNSFPGLNTLQAQVIRTMKLPGRDMSMQLIIILNAGGVTAAYLDSNKGKGNTNVETVSHSVSYLRNISAPEQKQPCLQFTNYFQTKDMRASSHHQSWDNEGVSLRLKLREGDTML